MGIPLTIQPDDEKKIEELKAFFEAPSKIAVIRMALALLDQERTRKLKVVQWTLAVKVAKKSSSQTNAEFRHGSTLGKKVV